MSIVGLWKLSPRPPAPRAQRVVNRPSALGVDRLHPGDWLYIEPPLTGECRVCGGPLRLARYGHCHYCKSDAR